MIQECVCIPDSCIFVCVCVLGAILGVPGVSYPVSFVVVFQWRLVFWNHFQADMPLCLQIFHVYSFVFCQGYWCTGLLWVCWSLQGMSLYCLNIVMGNQKLITWLNWDSFLQLYIYTTYDSFSFLLFFNQLCYVSLCHASLNEHNLAITICLSSYFHVNKF